MNGTVQYDPSIIHGINYRKSYPFWPYGYTVQEMGQDAFIGFVDFHTAGLGWHKLVGVHQTDYYRVRECAEDACLQWLAMCSPQIAFPRLHFKLDRHPASVQPES